MQHDEIKRELRLARLSIWWEKWDVMFYLAGMAVAGMLIGGYVTTVYDRAERMDMARRHDDDIRDMRMACRKTVDEQRGMVLEATKAATEATKAAAAVTAEDSPAAPPKPRPVTRLAVPRQPPVNLEEAVNRANNQIRDGRQ